MQFCDLSFVIVGVFYIDNVNINFGVVFAGVYCTSFLHLCFFVVLCTSHAVSSL